MSLVRKITYKQIFPVLTTCLKVMLWTSAIVRWGFPDSVAIRALHNNNDRVPVIFLLPTQRASLESSVLFQEDIHYIVLFL